jgi:hypothetical protein
MDMIYGVPHLSCKRNGWLVQTLLLRIPDVGRDDFSEGQAIPLLFQFDPVLLCSNGEFSTHGILDIANGGIEGVDSEWLHGVSLTDWGRWKDGKRDGSSGSSPDNGRTYHGSSITCGLRNPISFGRIKDRIIG